MLNFWRILFSSFICFAFVPQSHFQILIILLYIVVSLRYVVFFRFHEVCCCVFLSQMHTCTIHSHQKKNLVFFVIVAVVHLFLASNWTALTVCVNETSQKKKQVKEKKTRCAFDSHFINAHIYAFGVVVKLVFTHLINYNRTEKYI